MAPPSKKSKPKPNSKNFQTPSKKPAKAKGTHLNRAVSSLQMPVQVEDDVPDFPRGRGSLLSGEEENEVRALAEKESRADERVLKKRKKEKRAQNRNQSTEDDLGSLFGDGIIGKLPRFANKITLKNVSSGMKLWGVIAEVNEKDIVVSLPGGLRGLVRACDAIDPILDDEVKGDVDYSFLSRIYHEGQLVSCIVLQVEDDRKEIAKRKIWLSLRLSLLHKSLTLDTVQEGMIDYFGALEVAPAKIKRAHLYLFFAFVYHGCLPLYVKSSQLICTQFLFLEMLLETLCPPGIANFHNVFSTTQTARTQWRVKVSESNDFIWAQDRCTRVICVNVLSAYAKSIEDHGFMLHFGLPSFTGFMPKHSQSEKRIIDVSLGQLLQGVVKNIDRARKVVYLSSDLDMVSRCVTKDLKGISIDLLVPGMMVNAHVQSTLENGIILSFLAYFTGTVDVFNLDKTFPSSNWKNDYSKNMKFNARILFIDPSSRAVGLTLNPHLVSNKAPSLEIRLGDVDLIRGLFERAISLSLPPKKMKFLFKKYLEYEKSVGEEERIESVKKKAMEYVENTLA
ncbi:UNVERIFIED_CONTAM: rRNA biogenesis protein RRP5 [Sesamum indicum]